VCECGRTELVVLVVGLERYEAEHERDDGGDDEDDERDVLQRLPGQLQERLGRLGRDVVGAERRRTLLLVGAGVTQTCPAQQYIA